MRVIRESNVHYNSALYTKYIKDKYIPLIMGQRMLLYHLCERINACGTTKKLKYL